MKKELIEKLTKVQNELKAPKNQYNSFGGYAYRSCEDILESVKPLLKEQGLCLTITDTIVQWGYRYYVKATARLTDGECEIENEAFAREAESKTKMDDSQITGAASSYARKYALNGLFCIDDVKDADATNKHGQDEKSPSEKAKETREKNKAINEDLKHRATLVIDAMKTLKRKLTKEERFKAESMLAELQKEEHLDLANELAGILLKDDDIK